LHLNAASAAKAPVVSMAIPADISDGALLVGKQGQGVHVRFEDPIQEELLSDKHVNERALIAVAFANRKTPSCLAQLGDNLKVSLRFRRYLFDL
jgi:hypothetical protein